MLGGMEGPLRPFGGAPGHWNSFMNASLKRLASVAAHGKASFNRRCRPPGHCGPPPGLLAIALASPKVICIGITSVVLTISL